MLHKLVPEPLKRTWWYLTDSDWRAEYVSQQRRAKALRAMQLCAFRNIWEQTTGRVASGPFSGLMYLDELNGCYPQKLLGTYEKELWPVIEDIFTRPYTLVVDIGAAEGYYVCGLAYRMANVRIAAFEAQRACHKRICELARQNEVAGQIAIHGFCRYQDLRRVVQCAESALVICDVEGVEYDLLDPSFVPELRTADVLVEVHEHLRPGVREALLDRFSGSHEIVQIPSVARTVADLPEEISLGAELALAAMDECRGVEMEWFWMTHRSGSSFPRN